MPYCSTCTLSRFVRRPFGLAHQDTFGPAHRETFGLAHQDFKEPAWHRNTRRRRAEARVAVRLAKAVALLNGHHGSSAGAMPPQQPQQPSARGRWRQKTVWQVDTGGGWQTVTGKKAKRAAAAAKQPPAAPPPAAGGKPGVPNPAVRVVLLDGGAAAPAAAPGAQLWGGYTAKQWAAWRGGGWDEQSPDGHGASGWRRGRGKGKGRATAAPSGDEPAPAAGAAARDAEVDARTAALREQLLEARDLEAAHAKSADPCPQVAALLAGRSADLRRRLDDSKPRQDVYELHVKILAQLQQDADKLLQQATDKWATIADEVDAAKQLDAKHLATKVRIAEMQAATPAKAQAAGLKPPTPKLQAAFDVIKEQMEAAAAALPQQGAAAEAVRAMSTAAAEMQLRLTALNVARLETAAAQQPDDNMGRAEPTGTSRPATAPAPVVTAETRAAAASEAAPAEPPAPPAALLAAPGRTDAAAPSATGPTVSEVATVSASPSALASPPAEVQVVVQRACEVATRQDGDATAVAKARAALRARIDHAPDVDWLQLGISAVEAELCKHGGPAARPTRQRSRSRSGGTEGDDAAASARGDEEADELPSRTSGKGPGGRSGKGEWPAALSARSTPYGC